MIDKFIAQKGQIVTVDWVDSSILGGWVYGDVEATPKQISSAGFVVGMSDTAIVLSCSHSDSGGVIAPLTIPICCIENYTILV